MSDPLAALLASQLGVVARPQLLALGLGDHDIRRLQRRRVLAPVLPGVYLDHTGEPTWCQRAWAAVLYGGEDAALWGPSALRAANGPGRLEQEQHLHVAVPEHRRVADQPWVEVHRVTDLRQRVLWVTSPPRMRYEEAALDTAVHARDDLAVVSALAAACGSRRTTAPRLIEALDHRSRVARRDFLTGVLRDVADGTCSVLEHGFLTRVQRPHGLALGQRQVPATLTLGRAYRDVGLPGTWVELDGRLFHDSTGQRDRDMDRDLDAVVAGDQTIRLGYGQVFARPCATAYRLNLLLQRVAGTRAGHPCRPGCGDGGRSWSRGDCDLPPCA